MFILGLSDKKYSANSKCSEETVRWWCWSPGFWLRARPFSPSNLYPSMK